ncbi:MAG: hypothetical protein EDM05_60025 [Leptolyngbya sp. IPPAS B-1204]|nr:hypothetical protein [Elainella sp. C42_A2020_010]RNJ65658.1 MAG: hypothetical protein EDM05_30065 [Leptolyngbya sp. IPPAS B-1204]
MKSNEVSSFPQAIAVLEDITEASSAIIGRNRIIFPGISLKIHMLATVCPEYASRSIILCSNTVKLVNITAD